MSHPRELIMLTAGIGIALLVLGYRKHFERLPGNRLILGAYGLLVVGWAAALLGRFILPEGLTLVKSVCQAAAAIMLALWIARLPDPGEGPG